MLTFNSQYSYDSLFGSEQFNIGGNYSVRGFEDNNISGDNGYNIRNNLKINMSYLSPKNLPLTNILNKAYLTLFHDYGYIKNHYISDSTSRGYMSGIGATINYNSKYFNLDLTYAESLQSPEFIEGSLGQSKDREAVYINLNLTI